MRLYVEAHGRTVPLEVSGSTDAASVLRKLRRRAIRTDRLALRGRPWTSETVAQLGLQPHTTIQALGRLKGGCLEHSLKLYMRCMHLFKIIIAFYMFCMGPCPGVESNRCGRTPSRRASPGDDGARGLVFVRTASELQIDRRRRVRSGERLHTQAPAS